MLPVRIPIRLQKLHWSQMLWGEQSLRHRGEHLAQTFQGHLTDQITSMA
jgi:hypothetical protein